jgi:VanZ family protein
VQLDENRISLQLQLIWRGLAVAFLGVVVFMSLMPSPPQPMGLLGWDKFQHTAAYGFLAWWFLQAWEGRRALGWCVFLVIVGCLVEVLQGLTPLRQPSLLDVLANSTGVALGALLFRGPLGGTLVALEARMPSIKGGS